MNPPVHPEGVTVVVIPVHNRENYLKESVGSVLAQSTGAWRLVIVDDGSTDATGDVADGFARRDSRITVIHKENGGISQARNAALRHIFRSGAGKDLGKDIGKDSASGLPGRIVFLDSDDMLHPLFIERMTGVMASTGAEVACAATVSFHDGDRPSRRGSVPRDTEGCVEVLTPQEAQMNLFYKTAAPDASVWGKIYSTDLLRRVAGEVSEDGCSLFAPGIIYEDLDVMYRVLRACGKVAVDSTPLHYYRHTPGSLINTFVPRRLDVLDVTDRAVGFYTRGEGADPLLARAARNRRFAAACNMMLLMHRNRGSFDVAERRTYAAAMERCRRIVRATRREVLADSRARLRTRLGALLPIITLIANGKH